MPYRHNCFSFEILRFNILPFRGFPSRNAGNKGPKIIFAPDKKNRSRRIMLSVKPTNGGCDVPTL